MFRRVGNSATSRSLRRLYSQASESGSRSQRSPAYIFGGTLVFISAAVAGTQLSRPTIHNDAYTTTEFADKQKAFQELPIIPKVEQADGKLRLVVWGSNKSHVISSDSTIDSIHTPEAVSLLEGAALRDLALHSNHAACVDARGDVYQWGDGFFGSPSSASDTKNRGPALTLSGKNITRLQVTGSRVFALSASGKIYVLSAQAERQGLPSGVPSPSSSPWWGTGWLWGEDGNIDFAEIVPAHALAWGEKFVSIAAGRDHLLALTSSGRTFAHPITKSANTHGQLGFRKFDIPNPYVAVHTPSSRIHVELTPKAVTDPLGQGSRFSRLSLLSSPPSNSNSPHTSEDLAGVDDKNIRFCDRLFEIPSMKSVKVNQIAAGGRSSYVRTDTGRVLGWGANEHGQIGLGGNVVLDTISVPTEVVLWRSTPGGTMTKCVDMRAGGDLAFFTVERIDGSSIRSVDLLSCGNGQYGGLGNALFSSAQGVPSRTKSVSGLLEFSEKTNNLQPITPRSLSVAPDGHVLLTLDTISQAGPGGGGQDLFAWGSNYDYQVGNGKRTSIAVPATLSRPDGNRFMLMKTKAAEVKDAKGKVWKKNVEVEQVAVAGHGNSVCIIAFLTRLRIPARSGNQDVFGSIWHARTWHVNKAPSPLTVELACFCACGASSSNHFAREVDIRSAEDVKVVYKFAEKTGVPIMKASGDYKGGSGFLYPKYQRWRHWLHAYLISILRLALLLKKMYGATIFGRHQGLEEVGMIDDHMKRTRYGHSPDSWKRLCLEVLEGSESQQFVKDRLKIDAELVESQSRGATGQRHITLWWSVRVE
ncbi:hypothetical protein EW146_g6425 [Bondarzewia mesenterica]|uniref:Uncharacterized protein n=1 Tax=Bondarzewia mesenterica TaxID=1095465 RepID=A0A4S4LP81_9AGAM|nr:hypothetical protein EW146_g6425 [Bondarzewia mesenterica]